MEQKLDWNNYAGDYIKADNVKDFPCKFPVIGINEEDGRDNKKQLYMEVEYADRTWKFTLNASNRNFLKQRFADPGEVIGKVVVCNRVKVQNPSTKQTVWSLTIENVE